MKNWVSRLSKLLFLVIAVLLLPLSLLTAGARLPELYGESYYAELPDLVERLSTAEGNKLVVVGGSSVAFGLNGAQLEEELAQAGLSYTVCPFGLYAAVGTSAMLSLSLPCLGEGDVVVLALEPTSETNSSYFGATAFWKCAESHPELLSRMNGSQQSALAGSYLGYLQERWSIVSSGDLPQPEGVYAKSSFDERCDLTYDRPANTMTLGYDTSEPVDFGAVEIAEDFAEEVRGYVAAAEARGARVYLSFAPVNERAVTGDAEGLYQYFLRCCAAYGCTPISSPESCLMAAEWFYDSNFHLNTAGAAVRTHQLAMDLLAARGIYREPDWVPPEMPSLSPRPETGPEDGPGVDEADFLYEPLGEAGWIVTGLSDSGRRKTSLTLPASHEGKPVVAFTAEVFSDHPTLETVTLPDTIESIPDGAFSGSWKLTRLVLEHTGRVCGLGDTPFAGADQLTVYVPQEAYHLYRDGAGCEENPWQPYLDRIKTF